MPAPHHFDAVLTEGTIEDLKKLVRSDQEIFTTYHLKELMKQEKLLVQLKDWRAEGIGCNGLLVVATDVGFIFPEESDQSKGIDIYSIAIPIANGFGYRIRWSNEKKRMYVN
jgi:hypothetical protein